MKPTELRDLFAEILSEIDRRDLISDSLHSEICAKTGIEESVYFSLWEKSHSICAKNNLDTEKQKAKLTP